MTAVECISAVKFAVWHVFRIKGLTVWQRLQLALLKIVAVCGYHFGKYRSYTETPRGSEPIASREDALRAVHAVNGLVLVLAQMHCRRATARLEQRFSLQKIAWNVQDCHETTGNRWSQLHSSRSAGVCPHRARSGLAVQGPAIPLQTKAPS